MRSSLFLLILWLGIVCLPAIELPLVLSWESNNELSFLPEQTDKQYRFREFYQLGLGTDSLQVKGMSVQFWLQNRADFLSNQMEMQDFALGYQTAGLSLEVASRLAGYGQLNQTNPYHQIFATQDDFRYQGTRFNYLGLSYRGFTLESGGNTQNQLMLKATYHSNCKPNGFSYSLGQEARIHDSHWHTPVAISSLAFRQSSDTYTLLCESALSRFIEHDETPAHNSYYLLIQGKLKAKPWLQMFGTAEYRESEPNRKISKLVDAGTSLFYKQMVFTPGFRWDYLAGGESATYYLSNDWQFRPDQRVGLLLKAIGGSNPVYSLGFQAALRYSL